MLPWHSSAPACIKAGTGAPPDIRSYSPVRGPCHGPNRAAAGDRRADRSPGSHRHLLARRSRGRRRPDRGDAGHRRPAGRVHARRVADRPADRPARPGSRPEPGTELVAGTLGCAPGGRPTGPWWSRPRSTPVPATTPGRAPRPGCPSCRSRARPGSPSPASTSTAGSSAGTSSSMLPLARGPYLFGLHVLVPASSAGSAGRLMSELGAAQVRKVPADTPDTAPAQRCLRPQPGPWSAPSSATCCWPTASATCAIRCGASPGGRDPGASGWSRQRRLRRRRWRRRCVGGRHGAAAGSPSGGWRSSWPAWAWWPTRPTCSRSASGTRTWRPGWPSCGPAAGSSVPPERGAAANRAIMAGSHRVLVTVMLVVASAMILFGLAAIVAFGLYQTQPPGATVQDLPGLPGLGLSGLGLPSRDCVQDLATGLAGAGLGLLVLGAVIFLVARRLGSADARRLMLRDPRPPVLYLRSFGDDRLRLVDGHARQAFAGRALHAAQVRQVRGGAGPAPVPVRSRHRGQPARDQAGPARGRAGDHRAANWQSAVAGWMAHSAPHRLPGPAEPGHPGTALGAADRRGARPVGQGARGGPAGARGAAPGQVAGPRGGVRRALAVHRGPPVGGPARAGAGVQARPVGRRHRGHQDRVVLRRGPRPGRSAARAGWPHRPAGPGRAGAGDR